MLQKSVKHVGHRPIVAPMDAMDWLEDYERVKKSASSSKAKQANLAALDESLCKMERDPRGYDLSTPTAPSSLS